MKMIVVSVVVILCLLSGCGENNIPSSSAPTLEDISKKENSYTVSDCVMLLSSNLDEIAKVFNVDLTLEPAGGLLLDKKTMTTPVIFLSNKLAVSSLNKVEKTDFPLNLIIFGVSNESTPIEELNFGMSSDEVNITKFTLLDSFEMVSEAGPEEETKVIETVSDSIVCKSVFVKENEKFILSYVQVYFLQN